MSDCAICSIFLSVVGIFIIFPWALHLLKEIYQRWQKRTADISGQHVVITGGSSGIGKALGVLAAKRGANVTILARNVDRLEEAAKEIRSHAKNNSQKINFFCTDIVHYEETDHVITRCEVEVGPIDILVNCAGYAYPARLEDIPLSHARGMMDINFMGTFHAIRSALPSMKSRRKGKIVVVSSVGGVVGLYGYTVYAASKFAVRGFAEALQMEVKPFNIDVTVSFPPDTDTAGLTEENKIKPQETKMIGELAGVSKPEEVAQSILDSALMGEFFSSATFDAAVSAHICAGMAPASSIWAGTIQVLFAGPLRLIALCYNYYFNHLVAKCAAEKEKQKKSE